MQSMQSYDETGFLNGIDAWNWSPAPVVFVSGTSGIALYDTNAGNSGWDGYETEAASTFYCQNPSGYDQFAHAWAELNYYYTSGYYKSGSSGAIQSVAAHELGHAIGLGHSSSQTLMAPNTDRYWTYGINTPQQDDINGANYLYGNPC